MSVAVYFNAFLRPHDTFQRFDDQGFLVALMFHSRTTCDYLLAGVRWHDDRQGCPTWTDAAGCRCDVED